MIDFYHESDPVVCCPDCFNPMDLDEDFPDLVVYRCDFCVKHFSPTDLNRLVQQRRAAIAPSPLLGYLKLLLFIFVIILFLFWIF